MMQDAIPDRPVSKVLVLDSSAAASSIIKQFCEDNDLIGLKVRSESLLAVLRRNIDLGGILIAEDYGDSVAGTAAIAARIREIRPELPIILRRNSVATLTDLSPEQRRPFCAAYLSSDLSTLRHIIDEHIFSVIYPNALIRGIAEITQTILACQFPSCHVTHETAYIVRDRLIFGEMFSLIPLESNWCRGYMMLQTEEELLLALSGAHSLGAQPAHCFRAANSFLGELTNLIWGSFKNHYIGDMSRAAAINIQVPLVVNQQQKYISFGAENPQLCFRYKITDEASDSSVTIVQRFVFNLSWSPNEFRAVTQVSDSLLESGELEIF
jgi:CheY-specific phosphatase CheX